MTKIKLEDLTPEDRKQLAKEAIEAENAKKQAKIENRKAYKEMVAEVTPSLFMKLVVLNSTLMNTKQFIFESVRDLIAMKKDAYDVKEGQQSHTFTSKEGTESVTVGYRVIDGWDDTMDVGIEKVNNFIQGLVIDAKTEQLVKAINRLLRKDANGKLKSSRVLELQEMADDFNDPKLTDAIEIIRKSYRPKKSSWFIEATYTDQTGKKQNLPLSISSVDFPEGTDIDFL